MATFIKPRLCREVTAAQGSACQVESSATARTLPRRLTRSSRSCSAPGFEDADADRATVGVRTAPLRSYPLSRVKRTPIGGDRRSALLTERSELQPNLL